MTEFSTHANDNFLCDKNGKQTQHGYMTKAEYNDFAYDVVLTPLGYMTQKEYCAECQTSDDYDNHFYEMAAKYYNEQ